MEADPGLSDRLAKLERWAQVQDRNTAKVFHNQKVLSDSATKLDDQFAVLTRLVISSLRDLDAEITYQEVNALFKVWAAFRSRPDFRKHLQTWFMGGDVVSLPPLEVKEDGKAGGVDREERVREGDEETAPKGQEPDVPSMPPQDGGSDADSRPDGAEVSSVPGGL